MSAVKPVSSAAISGIPAVAKPSAPKTESKAASTAQTVISKLDQSIMLQKLASAGLQGEPALLDRVQKAMASGQFEGSVILGRKLTVRLGKDGAFGEGQKIAQQLQRRVKEVPVLSLKLNSQDETLLGNIFASRKLSTDVCLLSVIGVDLFNQIEKLRLVSIDFISHASFEFAMGWARLYANLLAQRIGSAGEVLPPDPSMIKKMVEHFEYLKHKFSILPEKGSIVRTVRTSISEIENKFSLICKLLKDPQAQLFLVGHTLREITGWSDKYFAKAALMNSNSPQETLQDMSVLMRLMSIGFGPGLKIELLGFEFNAGAPLRTALEVFAKQPDNLSAVKRLKAAFVTFISSMQKEHVRYPEAIDLVRSGELTYREYAKAHKINPIVDRPQSEFLFYLHNANMSFTLFAMLLDQYLQILDERVIEPLFPSCVPIVACKLRFHSNIVSVFKTERKALAFTHERFPSLPMSLTASQTKALHSMLDEVREDLEDLIEPLLDDPLITELDDSFFLRRDHSYTHFYMNVLPYLEQLLPIVNQINGLEMGKLRLKYLKRIEAFLKMLDLESVRAKRAEWVDYFQEVVLIQNLDFCRFAMLAQDIPAILQQYANTEQGYNPETLFSDSSLDYFDLTGIESMLAELLTQRVKLEKRLSGGPFPIREDLEDKPKRVKPTAVQITAVANSILTPAVSKPKAESKQPSAPSFVQAPVQAARVVELPAFNIRRGEKTRNIISRLYKYGFFLKTTRGSHMQFEHKEGKRVTVPVGGGHVHQKPGTTQSIARSASLG